MSNRADDAAWALALAHDKLWWNTTADLISRATPSVGGGLALLLLAGILALRTRSWTPLIVVGLALVLVGAVVASGKLLTYQGGVAGHLGYRIPGPRWPSGPGVTSVVVGGTALLLWPRLSYRLRAIGVLVVVLVVALNGAAEVFLGQHRLSDVVASWAAGLAIVAVVVAATGPRVRALASGPPDPLVARSPSGADRSRIA
ncbi:MAG: phosphatase PAP2 family protein [Pseudonocardia sp.]